MIFFNDYVSASIKREFIPIVLFLFPCSILLAITLSLFFGEPISQFSLISQSSDLLLQGKAFLIILLVLFLIGPFEEIGWHGYSIDILREKFNLIKTSLIFSAIWGLWHVPLFFIKNGGLQKEIWDKGICSGLYLLYWSILNNNRNKLVICKKQSQYFNYYNLS